jgi:hypothetical protein
MHQVMWETVFNQQFEQLLNNYGIDRSDLQRIADLRNQIEIKQGSGCVLMVEVEEGWQEKLIQLLEKVGDD